MGGLRWTNEQLLEFQERRGRKKRGVAEAVSESMDATEREQNLLDQVSRYCLERGFYFFHDRSRGVNTAGHPDLVIALPRGRTLWLELKSKRGRLSVEQRVVRLQLLSCEQEYHKVRSYRQFLAIINKMRGVHGKTQAEENHE